MATKVLSHRGGSKPSLSITLWCITQNTLTSFFIFFPYSESSFKILFSFLNSLQENLVIKLNTASSVPLSYVKDLIWTSRALQSWHPRTAAGPLWASDFCKKGFQCKGSADTDWLSMGSASLLDEKMQPLVTSRSRGRAQLLSEKKKSSEYSSSPAMVKGWHATSASPFPPWGRRSANQPSLATTAQPRWVESTRKKKEEEKEEK